jgi:hypothetical protein
MIIGGEGIRIGLIDTTVILETDDEETRNLKREAIAAARAFAAEHADEIEPYLAERVRYSEERRSRTPWYRLGEGTRLKHQAEYWDGTLTRLNRLDEASPRDLANYLGAFEQIQRDRTGEDADETPLVFTFDNVEEIVVFFKKQVLSAQTKAQSGLDRALDVYPDLDVVSLMDQVESGTAVFHFDKSFREVERSRPGYEYGFTIDRYDFVIHSRSRDKYRGYVRDILMLPLAANVPESVLIPTDAIDG